MKKSTSSKLEYTDIYANLEAFDIYITLNNGKTIKKRIRKNELNEAVIFFISFKLAKCEDINTNPQNKSNIYFGRKRAGKDEGRGGKEKVNVRVVLYFGIKIILIEVK